MSDALDDDPRVIALLARIRCGEDMIAELLETVIDLTSQVCHQDPVTGHLDSLASSSAAEALDILARFGRVRILESHGRRVIAERVNP